MFSDKEGSAIPFQITPKADLDSGLEILGDLSKQKLLAIGNALFPVYWSILMENKPELQLADRKDFPIATDFSVSEITSNSGLQAHIALTFQAENGIKNRFLGGYMHDAEGEVTWFAVPVGFEYTKQLVETFAEFFISELLNPISEGNGILLWNNLPEGRKFHRF